MIDRKFFMLSHYNPSNKNIALIVAVLFFWEIRITICVLGHHHLLKVTFLTFMIMKELKDIEKVNFKF